MGFFKFAKDVGKNMVDQATMKPLRDIINKQLTKDDEPDLDIEAEVAEAPAADGGKKVVVTGKVKTQEEAEKVIIAAGNNEGVSEVESKIEVEEPAPEAVFYEVKSGDTLSKIAKEHYGDANKYHDIFNANKPMLSDPDKIYPGQMLRIPNMDAKA